MWKQVYNYSRRKKLTYGIVLSKDNLFFKSLTKESIQDTYIYFCAILRNHKSKWQDTSVTVKEDFWLRWIPTKLLNNIQKHDCRLETAIKNLANGSSGDIATWNSITKVRVEKKCKFYEYILGRCALGQLQSTGTCAKKGSLGQHMDWIFWREAGHTMWYRKWDLKKAWISGLEKHITAAVGWAE